MASSFQIDQAGTSYRSGELQPASRSRQFEPSTSYYVPPGSGYQSPPVYGQSTRSALLDEPQDAFKDKGFGPPTSNITRMERVLGLNDFTNKEVWRGSLVEFAGVAIFEFALIAGIAACIGAEFDQTSVAIAVVYFLVWTASMLAAISLWVGAGHLNPVFTYTSMLTGHVSPVRAMLYMVAQSAGAIAGALAAKEVVQQDFITKNFLGGCLLGTTVRTSHGLVWPEGLGVRAGLIAEICFTFLLLFVAYSTTLDPSNFRQTGPILSALSVGSALGLLTFVSRQLRSPFYTGAGMNPARCLGPAIVQGSTLWDCHWVFWVGPFVAGTMFAVMHWAVVRRSSIPEDEYYGLQQPLPQVSVVPAGSGTGGPGAGPPAAAQEKRMDVFLHIKAMLHRSESERERSSRSRSMVEEVPLQREIAVAS